jgi:two-component system, chemotaxis family, sensor kinase CheA
VNDSEVIREFLIESTENLGRLDQEIVQLEQSPKDAQLLASVFRTMHTIKGTGGMLGFSAVEGLGHHAENLLSQVRNRERDLTPPLVSLILRAVDAVKSELVAIEAGGKESGVSHAALREELRLACESKQNTGQAKTSRPAEAAPAPAGEDSAGGQKNVSEDSTIRVDVGLLDRLMNQVGELVLARNQILQFNATREDSSFNTSAQRVDLITTELQEGVMKTRMQPIGNIWNKFPRVVRDVATGCGKQVRIEMEGKDTELDKTIIEAIKDPLTHLVRNAVDHGIETPAKRKAAGKEPEGRLLLRAFHEGGQVNIEITDDGAGLDHEKIRTKAIERNLVSSEQAARLTEREIANLIFLPGFSTAERVTNVSGRGVGMDVVKTNIEKIGGAVDVHSKPGQGSTVRMKIPLTLAIIPALVVTSAGDRYAIPQVNLLELIGLDGTAGSKQIEKVHGVPVCRRRGKLLPLVYLNEVLAVPAVDAASRPVNLVVLQAEDRSFGLVVDAISDTQEIVVKPLGKQLKGLNCYAGACIMGDGQVALILDVMGLAQKAHIIDEARAHGIAEKNAEAAMSAQRTETFLLFLGPDDARMAMRLESVARLEEVPASKIENAGAQLVAQYRGQILPLVNLRAALEERRGRRRSTSEEVSSVLGKPRQVVVCNHNGQLVGLLVERILDIVEDSAELKHPSSRAGILHSAVIQGKVTELLDIPVVLRRAGVLSAAPRAAPPEAGQ